MTNYNNINTNISFTSRPNTKKIIPKAQRVFKQFCTGIDSPTYIRQFKHRDDICPSIFEDLNIKLGFAREYRETLIDVGGLPEYFKGFLNIIKTMRVANCSEFSEIMKIILKLNKVRRCDMFAICSQKGNSSPKMLDHCIVALNVPKSKNNKLKQIPFVPKDNVIIVDMWWPNGFIGNIKKAKELYKIFGLEKDEKLMLRPIYTHEPNKKCFEKILTEYPQLKIT